MLSKLKDVPKEIFLWNIFLFLPIDDILKFELLLKDLFFALWGNGKTKNFFWKKMVERDFLDSPSMIDDYKKNTKNGTKKGIKYLSNSFRFS